MTRHDLLHNWINIDDNVSLSIFAGLCVATVLIIIFRKPLNNIHDRILKIFLPKSIKWNGENFVRFKTMLYFTILYAFFMFVVFSLSVKFAIKHGDTVKVPKLEGEHIESACVKLAAAHADLSYTIQTAISKDTRKGVVVSQKPKGGVEIKRGRNVQLMVSKGYYISTMPNYIGLNAADVLEEVSNRITSRYNRITIKDVKKAFNPKMPTNSIIAHIPALGEQILDNTGLTFVINSPEAKDYTIMPAVIGSSADEASNKLQSYSLKPKLEYQETGNENMVNAVIYQSKQRGELLKKGSEVTIAVGKMSAPELIGEEYVKMPNLKGRHLFEAASILSSERNGMKVQSKYVINKNFDRGVVIKQDPPAKRRVRKGAVVKLVLSAGQELTNMPAYTGMDLSNAVSNVYNELFSNFIGIRKLSLIETYIPEYSNEIIIAQSPCEGDKLMKGSEIKLLVNMKRQSSNSNNYLGASNFYKMNFKDVYEQLSEAGVEVELKTEIVKYKKNIGKIMSSSITNNTSRPLNKLTDSIAFSVGTTNINSTLRRRKFFFRTESRISEHEYTITLYDDFGKQILFDGRLQAGEALNFSYLVYGAGEIQIFKGEEQIKSIIIKDVFNELESEESSLENPEKEEE